MVSFGSTQATAAERSTFHSDGDPVIGTRAVLMTQDGRLSELWLPADVQGSYGFPGLRGVVLEASEGAWQLRCSHPYAVRTVDGRVTACALEPHRLTHLTGPGWGAGLYAEPQTRASQVWRPYELKADRVDIGRSQGNHVRCASPFVSRRHAHLERRGDRWWVVDDDSANHVFVNGRATTSAPLTPGDRVYVLGLHLIFGDGFVCVKGDHGVSLDPEALPPVATSQRSEIPDLARAGTGSGAAFNRAPRRRLPLRAEPIEVEAPPMPLGGNQIPLLLRMGGSLVSGGTAALMGHFGSLLSSVLFPFLSQRYTEKDRQEYESRRQTAYHGYLRQAEKAIEEERRAERRVWEHNHPSLATALGFADRGRRLWERRPADDDFLRLRLGTGSVPLAAELRYPRKRFSMDRDALEEEMFQLMERPALVDRAPITASLVEEPVWSIVGPAALRWELARQLLLQTVLLHSYDEVKVVVLGDEGTLAAMPWLRYLPHLWDTEHRVRLCASTREDAYRVGEHLREQVGPDLAQRRDLDEVWRQRPHYVVFALDRGMLDAVEVVKEAMGAPECRGLSVVVAAPEAPKETVRLVEARPGGSVTSNLRQIEQEPVPFTPESVPEERLERAARALATVELQAVREAQGFPETVSFLEMYGVSRVEDLAPLRRWAQSDPAASLAAPVGVAADGSLFLLDLHEKAEGPHGLVAGMTGSGKSEFLLSYLLALAVEYHPDEVAFLLIDYKGGGLAGAFVDEKRGVRLPHVVGTITNLDGAAIARSLTALEAELRRRQQLFNDAKSALDLGTLDIYQYQRLYRQGKVDEPLPHLFIVSDEFAELKQQEPEFMDQLISTARIGRSLGVHLVLATQRPAGVVNDQILSNTKFRVCLKVQDRSDSMDVLRRPEAAEISQTGRFYLQVGYNEHFSQGQSAWSGAPYVPGQSAQEAKASRRSVRLVDRTGRTVGEGRGRSRARGTGRSQLVEVVDLLCASAAEAGVAPRQLWRDPLPPQLEGTSLEQPGPERPWAVAAGLWDDPGRLEQRPFELDLGALRHLLVLGPAGAGKGTLLQSLLLGLCGRLGPDQLVFYARDLTGALGALDGLPHSGGVLGEGDQDLWPRLFARVRETVAERRRLLRQWGAEGFEEGRRRGSWPLVLVALNGIQALGDTTLGQTLLAELAPLLRDGPSVGVRFVVSAGQTRDVPARARLELDGRVALGMADRYDYGDALGCRCGYLPPLTPGRGLALWDGRPLELQVARWFCEAEGAERAALLRAHVERVAERWRTAGQGVARRLPFIPEDEDYAGFRRRFSPGRLPLGFGHEQAQPVGLPERQWEAVLLVAGDSWARERWLDHLLATARAEGMETVAVCAPTSVLRGQPDLRCAAPGQESLRALAQELVQKAQARRAVYEELCAQEGLDPRASGAPSQVFDRLRERCAPLLVVFEDFSQVCEDSAEDIEVLLGAVFRNLRRTGMHVAACAPVPAALGRRALFRALEPALTLTVLAGGRGSDQDLLSVPYQHTAHAGPLPAHRALARYRDAWHELWLPLGEAPCEADDDRDIFL